MLIRPLPNGSDGDLIRVRQPEGQLLAVDLQLDGVPQGGEFYHGHFRAGDHAHVQKMLAERALSAHRRDDGALYFLDLSRGAYYRNGNFPDTFTLKSKTDDEITFTVIGYYSSPWPNEGESFEERDQRLKDGWEYTIDFNIRLVRTAEGWRFDDFHGTAADQEDPETAALSRKLQAQE